MREEREVLEDRRGRTLVRLELDERLAVERRCVPPSGTRARRSSAGSSSCHTGRAEETDVLAVVDVEVHVLDGDRAAGELLRQADEVQPCSSRRWWCDRGGGGGDRRPSWVSRGLRPPIGYALMKSFTFLTWYTLLVKNEFQDEYFVERLTNDPPSRTSPSSMSPTLPRDARQVLRRGPAVVPVVELGDVVAGRLCPRARRSVRSRSPFAM